VGVRPVLVCDVCDADDQVQTYKIAYPDRDVWQVELCGKHAELLTQFQERGKRVTRGKKRAFEVTTVDEVQKRARRRP